MPGRTAFTLLALAVLLCSAGAKERPQSSWNSQGWAPPFQSVLPLGIEKVVAQPSRRDLVLMATAESPLFANWLFSEDHPHEVRTSDGELVRYLPEHLEFRVTASLRIKGVVPTDEAIIPLPNDLEDYIRQLRFQVKLFDGLNVTTIQPESVQVIGVPMDYPSDERVWRLSMNLPAGARIDERLVLEVLSPDGDRLCKFHMEF